MAKSNEQIKYEIADDIGLLDKVRMHGWKGLSSKETGKIGGLTAQKRKEIESKEKRPL